MTVPINSRRRRRFGLPAALFVAASLAALPTAAQAADQLSLVDKTEQIGPGITLQHLKTLSQSGWLDEQVLTADLSNPAVSSDLLTAPSIAQGGPLTTSANKAGAVAGINGDFFDINNSTAAQGLEIQGGTLLKSQQSAAWNAVGVGQDGIGHLIDSTLDSKATVHGVDYTIATLNAANGSLPADSMVAFTPAWGTYSRAIGTGGASNVAEATIVDGKVVSVNATGAGSGSIPDNGFVLVGRDKAADSIRTFQPGDAAALTYALKDDVAKNMKFALGDSGPLVVDGVPQPSGDTSFAPRSAIGFKDGGHTLLLATADGRQTNNAGPNLTQWGQIMAGFGATTAVNLDGGGSTTMVAAPLGQSDVTVRNTPSDGTERSDPNGVGLFVSPGDGKVHDLVVSPSGDDASAFPGLHATLTAKAVDDHQRPVALPRGDVRWTATNGDTVDNGQLTVPSNAKGDVTVRATTDTAQQDTKVRVLDPVQTLVLSTSRLSFTGTDAAATTITVNGRDDQGYTAPIEPEDLDLDYDHSVVKVTPDGTGLKIQPLKTAGTQLKITAAGKTEILPISVGVQTIDAYDFNAGGIAAKKFVFTGTATAHPVLSDTADGIKVDFDAARNIGITSNGSGPTVQPPLPGQPLVVTMHVYSSVPMALSYLSMHNGNGGYTSLYSTPIVAGWQDLKFAIPASTPFPLAFDTFQGIETTVANQKAGTMTIGSVSVDVPSAVDLPGPDPVIADPLISPDGKLPTGGKDWNFATLSDIQFTADAPELAKVGVAAIQRIRKLHPDLLVLNGDVTDRGLPQDMTLARTTLEAAGCDLIKVGEEPAPDSTPDPTGKLPCYYVPGNHESYGLGNVQSDTKPFEAEFGQPYRTFDHKGTRFILLDSALGSLAGSAWAQMPMFQKALDTAQADPSIDNVMVFAHHPVDDPAATKSSQLGDRTEVALVEKMLTDFRDKTGKGAAMVGSHAQIANVHRIDGVPYTVLPSSGKDPYGTPDTGGFTGFLDWAVDPSKAADQQWLTADVNAFAQSITLNTPDTVEVSQAATLSGSIVQPEGVSNGSRVVPLRYPMSIHWSGSDGLAVGTGQAAIDAARAAGKIAIIDPVTEQLTGLKAGKVAVAVTNQSMREYTDDASLAPVTTSKTVTVVPFTGSGPRVDVATPIFPDQQVGTIGEGQLVTINNTGDQPLHISNAKIQDVDGLSSGDFLLSADQCTTGAIAPGASCTVLVRFAPARTAVASHERLVFTDDTADQSHTVDLTGMSVAPPAPGQKGDQGDTGPAGPQGPTGDTGAAGPKGDAGDTGPKGDAGTNGVDGAIGPVGPQGDAGKDGLDGVTGAVGAQGAVGPKGDKGAKGDPGKDAAVTCTIKTTKGKKAVVCKVVFVGTAAKARTAAATVKALKASKAKLVRGNHTYASGKVGQLHTTRKLVKGSYQLRVTTGTKTTATYKITLK
jgi:exopolysaccharide biosynthesis protein/3',5'-cyclic AMP phosphodiesterase CpdA